MKKIIGLMLAVLFICGAFAGCKGKESSTSTEATTSQGANVTTASDKSLQNILDKKVLVFGFDEEFKPMGFKDSSGKHVGFDIDLANEVAKRMNIQIKLQPIIWDNKIMELNNKNIDCIWNGFTISDEAKSQILFSDAYMKNNQVLVVLKDSKYSTKEDLKSKTVALQKGSSASIALDKNKEFKSSVKPILLNTNLLALNELKNKTADAVLMDEIAVNYAIAADKENFRVLEGSFAAEEYGIGFRKGEQALCDEIVKQLKAMKADGKLAEISTKWFGKDITTIQ
ncbi:MAG: hypothetical protein BGN88_14580 [Clostridiales bacterium 43-6]|nr:MAG: hypothetical protein BGN88_14580 [Clostridiales bacterium 43-6]